MRSLHATVIAVLCVAVATAATAQNRVAPSTSTAQSTAVSQAQTAMSQAAAARKYAFLFFWKEKNAQTDRAWSVLQSAVAKLADAAQVVSIQITDPAERKLVDKYGVTRAPMPLVLAVAPCGAITKAFTKAFDENQLRTAFVSPCTQLCLKALQSRKLVLACVVDQPDPQGQVTIPKGVEEFKADAKFGSATEIVLVNAKDQSEAAFLKDFQVRPQSAMPVVVFLAPPGVMIGKFDGTTTKREFVAKLAAAQSNPCAGGKCGPGGCGPKKK